MGRERGTEGGRKLKEIKRESLYGTEELFEATCSFHSLDTLLLFANLHKLPPSLPLSQYTHTVHNL